MIAGEDDKCCNSAEQARLVYFHRMKYFPEWTQFIIEEFYTNISIYNYLQV